MLPKISLTAIFVTLMVSQALADDVDRGVEAALGGAAGGLISGRSVYSPEQLQATRQAQQSLILEA